MEEKLTALAQIIEDHFDKEVWHSEPPIHETDLKLVLLATRMYSLRRNLIKIKDIETELTELKLYMKQEFKIIEVFDKEKPNINKVLQDIFKSYIKDVINKNYDLNNSK